MRPRILSTGTPAARALRVGRLKQTGLVVLCQALLLGLLLVVWEYVTAQDRQTAFLFGSPSAIWGFLLGMWQDGSLFRDTYVTGLETVVGFFIGNVLGTLIGLSLWYSQLVSRIVQPFVVALGSIPIIALAPLVIIWFGTGLGSKVAMATLSVVVVALVTSYKGAMSVDPDQVNLMRTLGASKPQIFRKLVIPASLSDIFAGLKLTVGFALIGAIIGEFMSSSEGLGHAIFKAGSLYIIPKVFAALVVTIALALVLTYLVGKLERLLTPWQQAQSRSRTVEEPLKRVTKSGNIKYALSGDDPFVARVAAGETFVVEAAININDGVIRFVGQQLTEADVTLPFVNGATGPIEVEGAKPGDMLGVEVLQMELEGLGFTSLWPGIGIFPDWVRRKEFGIQTRVVEVKDGLVHWSDKVKFRVRPMIGVVGVAPVHGAVLTVDNGPHGGNLDVQEIAPGNTLMLRVHRNGAHLFLGDCHAIQGDGECNGMGAIEIAAVLTVRVTLAPAPRRMTWPRIVTPTHICTLGCARPLEDAMRTAFEEMVYWLEDEYAIPEPEGYMLLGQIAEARCTQMVNPKFTYICKVPKEILAAYA